jgi:hypothetical protein
VKSLLILKTCATSPESERKQTSIDALCWRRLHVIKFYQNESSHQALLMLINTPEYQKKLSKISCLDDLHPKTLPMADSLLGTMH